MVADRRPLTINEYIAAFQPQTQQLLEQVRWAIHEAAPDAEETISYAMPAFKLKGNLVYFASYKPYVSFYANPQRS
ncbi:DUF1801 domain-containing protein [Mucilaginibacter sp. CSA2-8R]|uniref:iron chaperone n=1 Tax=Mucilaginibacter sp. CSA2-8R TaxID=3141542 RepID=UPI00315C99AC